MNSTRPTTSASDIAGATVAVGLAGLAALTLYAKCLDLWGSFALSRAGAALEQAQGKAPSATRDKALADGVASAQNGIAVSPDDPRLWDTIAEIRLQQAISGAAGGVSPTLLAASAAASQHAAILSPRDGEAQARLALVKGLQRDAPASAAALAQSYDVDFSINPAFAPRRLEAAARAWSAMDETLRKRVVGEACTIAARSDADRARVQALRMGYAEAGLALALDQVLADPSCSATLIVPTSAPATPTTAAPAASATKP